MHAPAVLCCLALLHWFIEAMCSFYVSSGMLLHAMTFGAAESLNVQCMDCRDSALSYWVPLSHASHGIPSTTCKQLYCTTSHITPCSKQVALLHVYNNLSMPQMCHQFGATLQATPANWPCNHDSIGKKGWAFLLPTVTPEDAKKHFPDHHSCKVHCHPAMSDRLV